MDYEYFIVSHSLSDTNNRSKKLNYSLVRSNLHTEIGYEILMTANHENTAFGTYERPKDYIFRYLLKNNLISLKKYGHRHRQLDDTYCEILKDCLLGISGGYTYDELMNIIEVNCKNSKLFCDTYIREYHIKEKLLNEEYKTSVLFTRLLNKFDIVLNDLNVGGYKHLYLIEDILKTIDYYNYNYNYKYNI